jgi:hypothetical protein
MLDRKSSLLIVTDIQGRLATLMDERESLFRNVAILIEGIKVLGIPIIWIEQYPQGLGSTIPEIATHLEGLTPLPKKAFCALNEPTIDSAFKKSGRHQVILTGIETHICIYQTSLALLSRGNEVYIPEDAVSSRSANNRRIGLNLIERAGGHRTCVETVLFELLAVAEGDEFKKIVHLVK